MQNVKKAFPNGCGLFACRAYFDMQHCTAEHRHDRQRGFRGADVHRPCGARFKGLSRRLAVFLRRLRQLQLERRARLGLQRSYLFLLLLGG